MASAIVIVASAGAARRTWAGTSNTASRPSVRAIGEDRLPRLHHLTGFGGSRRDRSLDIGLELGKAHPVLSDVELGGRIVNPGLSRLQRLLRGIEVRPGGEAALHQMVLAVERVLRLDLLAVGGVQRRLRRTERVEFVLRIEFRQHLVRLDLVADLALPLDDPSANAEGEVHLVFSTDIPGELDLVADRAFSQR